MNYEIVGFGALLFLATAFAVMATAGKIAAKHNFSLHAMAAAPMGIFAGPVLIIVMYVGSLTQSTIWAVASGMLMSISVVLASYLVLDKVWGRPQGS